MAELLLESQPPGCFLHPWPLLLLFPDATNSHRKSQWNFSGHFKPEGRYGGSDQGCHSHSSCGIYGAEPQAWLHQEQEIHILFWALLSSQGKSTLPFVPASSWGPRREELVGSPWWIRAGTEDFLENSTATPFLQGFISLWRLTMMVTSQRSTCSQDGLPGAQSWRLSGRIIYMLRRTDVHSCCSSVLQSLHVF